VAQRVGALVERQVVAVGRVQQQQDLRLIFVLWVSLLLQLLRLLQQLLLRS
jgi:hypothetical protein